MFKCRKPSVLPHFPQRALTQLEAPLLKPKMQHSGLMLSIITNGGCCSTFQHFYKPLAMQFFHIFK